MLLTCWLHVGMLGEHLALGGEMGHCMRIRPSRHRSCYSTLHSCCHHLTSLGNMRPVMACSSRVYLHWLPDGLTRRLRVSGPDGLWICHTVMLEACAMRGHHLAFGYCSTFPLATTISTRCAKLLTGPCIRDDQISSQSFELVMCHALHK
jgi:hypothetical protein